MSADRYSIEPLAGQPRAAFSCSEEAFDGRFQGQVFARLLLVDALRRARDVTSQVAAVLIIVDAKSEEAASFYERFGFGWLEGERLRLFLLIATLRGV